MPASYKIDKENRIVLSTAWGVLSREDIAGHKEKLLRDPDFDPTYSQIADFTQVSELELTAEEIRGFAESSVFSPQSRRALIAPTDVEYGMARMFATLRELAGDKEIGVFRTLEEAQDWVLEKSA